MIKTLFSYLMPLLLSVFVSCSDMIEYSPYDTEVSKDHSNAAEVNDIINLHQSPSDTVKFAFLSDIHDNYDDLADAISCINKKNNLVFIACCGDLTNAGLAQEFEWYVDVIEKSRYPFISVIGNHDYRSNGQIIYTKTFGPTNFSFNVNNYKFIIFDNNIWENNNSSPAYAWLSNEFTDTTNHHVVMAHIPPWGDQMIGINNLTFCKIVNSTNTMLCLHGHEHVYYDTCYNNIHTLVSEAINAREYYIISLINDQSFVERICY